MQMTALTFNNLGCFYKKTKKLKVAFRYLKMALEIETKSSLNSSIASTKLNICAILSSLMKHSEAIKYAASAIGDLLKRLKFIKIKKLPSPKRNAILNKYPISKKELEIISED